MNKNLLQCFSVKGLLEQCLVSEWYVLKQFLLLININHVSAEDLNLVQDMVSKHRFNDCSSLLLPPLHIE